DRPDLDRRPARREHAGDVPHVRLDTPRVRVERARDERHPTTRCHAPLTLSRDRPRPVDDHPFITRSRRSDGASAPLEWPTLPTASTVPAVPHHVATPRPEGDRSRC